MKGPVPLVDGGCRSGCGCGCGGVRSGCAAPDTCGPDGELRTRKGRKERKERQARKGRGRRERRKKSQGPRRPAFTKPIRPSKPIRPARPLAPVRPSRPSRTARPWRTRQRGNGKTGERNKRRTRQRDREATSQQDEERRREARALARAGDSGVATDGARDTSQIDVTALHERDRVITEGLHEARACQRGMRLSTPVSHSGRSLPGRPTASPARVRTSPGITRSRIPVAPAGTRCEAHHETSVRPPRARPWRGSSRSATNRPGRLAVPWPEPVGNLPSIRAATAPRRLRPTVRPRAVITARHSSVRPWWGSRGRLFRSPAGRPQFGPVVDLAYTRWRASW